MPMLFHKAQRRQHKIKPATESQTIKSKTTSPAREDIMTLIQQMKEVYESLEKQDKINLSGPSGIGKTRMAKKISEYAIREKQTTMRKKVSDQQAIKGKLFNFTLWVFMCRQYTLNSLSQSIARQLFLIRTYEEREDEDDSNKHERDADGTDNLIQSIKEKLKGNKILVILDDVPDGETKSLNETTFWSVWEQMLPVADLNITVKQILISRIKRDDEDFVSFEVIKALPRDVSINLLKEKLIGKFNGDTPLAEKVQNLGVKLLDKFNGDLPGNVIIIAKVLNYFCLDASGMSIITKELEEASDQNFHLSKFLCMKDDVLPIDVLKDLWWHGDHFYRNSGSVHYSELITYWILEGYLGVGSMSKLYQKGHGVLLDLIDCGVIKVQEGGYVFMDNSLINARDLYQHIEQNPRLGFAAVINSEEEGFGRITHNDGMLKTTPTRQKKKEAPLDESRENLLTLLLDGTIVTEQVIKGFLESEKKLQVFGLFYPTIRSLPQELGMLEGLRVLVLRGCEFLKDARLGLKALEVLEISDAQNLKRLNSSFFKNMLNLKSLHISRLQITSLPQAIYNLTKIQWLIVKDCPQLQKVESISKLEKLIVVDLSGNISLDTLDKNFLKFQNLQSLNLSKTLVSTTPLLKNRSKLTHLLCSECPGLVRLRGLTSLTSLQTIDLSGSKEFEEFHDSSLESLSSLITLNLSRTRIDHLPSNISKPRYLYLECCLHLQRLSCIVSSKHLVVLSLSGSTNLNEIEDKFFDDMSCLRVLNLSETSISRLPSLSNLSDLRKLFLTRCHSLTDLPSLESSTKLEILDASNCFALHKIESKSFESMTRLHKIDFSETKIKSLPSLPSLCNIRQLILKNCNALQDLELNGRFLNLEELNLSGIKSLKPNGAEFVKDISSLRILDLSYTSIKQLPSMLELTNLTHLSVAGCMFSSETELDYPRIKIEVLDLSQSSIECLPKLDYTNLGKLLLKDCSIKEILDDVISTSTRLDYIEFPNINVEKSLEDVNQDNWNICRLSNNDKPPIFLNATQFLKKNPLQRDGSYHLCAVPIKVEDETWDKYLHRHELVFHDVHLQACRFAKYKDNKSLQIRGFNQFPNGIENIITDIDLVFLIDYKLNGFPSAFDPSKFSNLKGCWIESCNQMVNTFTTKEGNDDNPKYDIRLQDLGICNNIRLRNIYEGKQSFGSFNNLESLYIDSCPEITTVFSSSWLPNNLQVLEIKYCDKIFEFGGELPASLQTLKIWECPKVKQLEDQFEIPKDLKTLWISGANSLKNLVTKNNDPVSLESLKVGNCPMLKYLVSSSSILASIQIIEIRSCEKMRALCTDISYETTWLELKKLHLEGLPMLKQIGANFPSSSVAARFIFECPNLQDIFD